MASFQYSTGPCFIYVRFNIGTAPGNILYLGTAQKYPIINNRPYYDHVFADTWGHSAPADSIYDGQDAIVSCAITRFEEDTVDELRKYAPSVAQERGRSMDGCL